MTIIKRHVPTEGKTDQNLFILVQNSLPMMARNNNHSLYNRLQHRTLQDSIICTPIIMMIAMPSYHTNTSYIIFPCSFDLSSHSSLMVSGEDNK